jgi:hypothetical protein
VRCSLSLAPGLLSHSPRVVVTREMATLTAWARGAECGSAARVHCPGRTAVHKWRHRPRDLVLLGHQPLRVCMQPTPTFAKVRSADYEKHRWHHRVALAFLR